jgi:AMME syndrome candidate gene 1 protein
MAAATAAPAAASTAGSGGLVATAEHVAHVFDVLAADFAGAPAPPPAFDASPSAPFFVTLKKRGALRGCIGTLSARPLAELGRYGRKSAFEDRRFDPVEAGELPALDVGVSLLVNYEEGRGWDDWTPGTHGIIIDFAVGGVSYSATYLPEVAPEQGWGVSEAVASLIRKAGCHKPLPPAAWAGIRLTRYQSSKATLTYDEYVAMRALGGGGGGGGGGGASGRRG